MEQTGNKALILDLRNNPGGLLISAVEVAELFVDIGEIVQIRDRQNKVIERYIARESAVSDRPFLIVLINGFTASAAEIVAGVIRDRGIGLLIGERSYGKGVVQSVFPVGADLYVKITTAQYYTPSEIGFNGVGIEPDIPVHDSISASRYGQSDSVFQKAVEIAEAGILRR
jgi:carboxyl-terminal processing protease